jgi:hypothetical protein
MDEHSYIQIPTFDNKYVLALTGRRKYSQEKFILYLY